MGSRSRFKGQQPKDESAASKIETGKQPCLHCNKPLFNPFRTKPWHEECEKVLKDMHFNGEQVLDLVLAMMPPTPPHPEMQVKVTLMHQIARQVLIDVELVLPKPGERKFPAKEIGKPSIIT
jgi:hypothetical protein